MTIEKMIPYELRTSNIGEEFKFIIDEIIDDILAEYEKMDKSSELSVNYLKRGDLIEFYIKFKHTEFSRWHYQYFRIAPNSLIFMELDFLKVQPEVASLFIKSREKEESKQLLNEFITILKEERAK